MLLGLTYLEGESGNMRKAKAFLENSFSFLENSFTKEILSRNSEINIVYTNKTTIITIIYDLCIDGKYHVEIIIERNGTRKNLLSFHELFGIMKLQKLKSQLSETGAYEQIILYSNFIENNVSNLQF